MSPSEQQLEDLVQKIVAAVHPLRIILFGSAARDEAGVASDLDLLVVMPDGTHRRHTVQHLYREIRGVTVPYDLLVATPRDLEEHRDNPGLIYRSILREGRTLYAA
jgi:predicted nucleotidyltransferase